MKILNFFVLTLSVSSTQVQFIWLKISIFLEFLWNCQFLKIFNFQIFFAKIILTSLFLISKSKVNFLSAVGVKLIGGELTTRIKPISVNCPQFDSVRNKGVKFDDSFSLTHLYLFLYGETEKWNLTNRKLRCTGRSINELENGPS